MFEKSIRELMGIKYTGPPIPSDTSTLAWLLGWLATIAFIVWDLT